MGLALFRERRLKNRKKLTGLLPGRLVAEQLKEEINCRLVDVSKNGMGILFSGDLDIDSRVILHIPGSPLSLRVASKSPDFGKQKLFRYGLVIDREPREQVNLETLFISAGCLV
jgi:hypothetical protein